MARPARIPARAGRPARTLRFTPWQPTRTPRPDRRTRSPRWPEARGAPRLGAPLRSAPAEPYRGRAAALLPRRRAPRADSCSPGWPTACRRPRRPGSCSPTKSDRRLSGHRPPLEGEVDRLRDALDRFDADTANATFDRLLASFTLDTVLEPGRDAVSPRPRRALGRRQRDGRPGALRKQPASRPACRPARAAGSAARGPLALLACAPGEQHDLPFLVFGLALRARGWRIAYLGQDTPAESIVETAAELAPALVVVSATARSRFRTAASQLAASRPHAAARHRRDRARASRSRRRSERAGSTEGPVDAAEQLTLERADRVARA